MCRPRLLPKEYEVQAVVTAPLFSSAHKLVLPEGTLLTGEVALARNARHFHRAGRLRFNFQKVDLPQEVANLRPTTPKPVPMQRQALLRFQRSLNI